MECEDCEVDDCGVEWHEVGGHGWSWSGVPQSGWAWMVVEWNATKWVGMDGRGVECYEVDEGGCLTGDSGVTWVRSSLN